MNPPQTVHLTRDVEAALVPSGHRITLKQGEPAVIVERAADHFVVEVHKNRFRIEAKDADALGQSAEATAQPESAQSASPASESEAGAEAVKRKAEEALRTCYDPEIPVNIVDLGLIYGCEVTPIGPNSYRVDVKMTLTAPGCAMAPMIVQDVQTKLLGLEEVAEANVELVWDPPWTQDMLSDAAKLQLGLM